MKTLKKFIADIVRLRLPVTAAATVATLTAYLTPFGIDIGGKTTGRVTAALVLVGFIAERIKTWWPTNEPANVSGAGAIGAGEIEQLRAQNAVN